MAVVLLIEDNKSTRLLTKLNLQQEYQILEAGNGLEALDILEQQHIGLWNCAMALFRLTVCREKGL